MADIDLQRQVFLHQIQHSKISTVGNDLFEQILLDLPFLFPQRKIPCSACRSPVIFVQSPAVNEFVLAVQILVLISISAILTLALSVM